MFIKPKTTKVSKMDYTDEELLIREWLEDNIVTPEQLHELIAEYYWQSEQSNATTLDD